MGFTKMVNEIDAKEAARLGLQTRPLTTAVIQKHLEDVGIEPEFGTHSRMRGLSGGQKVKVVLAAAMWNNPHILVLDEPTNYLDRESLGALAGAIRGYGGGCLMISHNRGKTMFCSLLSGSDDMVCIQLSATSLCAHICRISGNLCCGQCKTCSVCDNTSALCLCMFCIVSAAGCLLLKCCVLISLHLFYLSRLLCLACLDATLLQAMLLQLRLCCCVQSSPMLFAPLSGW